MPQAAWDSLQTRTRASRTCTVLAPEVVAVTEEDTHHSISIIEAVNDDKPFLFGSLKNELHAQNLEIHLVVHPILSVERDAAGTLIGFHGEARPGDGHAHESFVHIHVEPLDDADHREALRETLLDGAARRRRRGGRLAEDARAAARGDRALSPGAAAGRQGGALRGDRLPGAVERSDFILTGMREYMLDGSPDDGELVATENGGLGILRDPDIKVLRRGAELVTLTPEVREFLTSRRARLHRQGQREEPTSTAVRTSIISA